jgi:uncharacterized membrane protein YcaP (DUF421 family)
MEHLTAPTGELAWIALKAILLYLTAVLGFRLGERRTLAQLSPFDVVAAVAVGAIVGRVPNAHDASYLSGAATLVAILVAHAALTRLRLLPGVAKVLEHPPRLLVADGRVLDDELRRCGLTRSDLEGVLRQHGIEDAAGVRFVVFEQRGQISVVHHAPSALLVPELPRASAPGGAAPPAAGPPL